jgi:diguanylate cyclase (GGDEF)-like protein/PAS domain S-box-containing protein
MTDTPWHPTLPGAQSADVLPTPDPELRIEQLHGLLSTLASSEAAKRVGAVVSPAVDQRLVQVRLGLASSLFAALQFRNAAKAGHCLRVALTCSAWSLRLGLPEDQREAIELAALLHDVGVIGAPDAILLKPGSFDAEESALMAQTRQMTVEILRRCCNCAAVMEIVEHIGQWYDGSTGQSARKGKDVPLGARMINIVEAFDAMTTDHIHRPAMSQEQAIKELFECAGSQFDPDLVRQFTEFCDSDLGAAEREVAARWLHSLDPELVNSYWQLNCVPSAPRQQQSDDHFHRRLLEGMYDGVVFVDANGRIAHWNRGAERLTGIPAASVQQRQWTPELLQMADERGQPIALPDCPFATAIRSGVQSLRRLSISGRSGRTVAVDAHTMPVIDGNGATLGAILLLHDASSEISLEQRCQSLYEKATKDPLTQVANRAELERVHEMFISAHQQQQAPCSLMLCDLDHFKQINDTFGHQAGDEVIKSLAALLKSACGPGDMVARYGGEEFVLLCADCDNASAARRAEQIRKSLAQIPQPALDGRCVTVSIGVTEVQPGDTAETMLRRADRALLTAKAKGRNRVVQLGTGSGSVPLERKRGLWPFGASVSVELLTEYLSTPVPLKLAVEKLRGFVVDHQARIIKSEPQRMVIEIDDRDSGRLRRFGDRPVCFTFDVQLVERRHRADGNRPPQACPLCTRIRLTVTVNDGRERRREEMLTRARRLVISFRSYLMASIDEQPWRDSMLTRAKRLFVPWLSRDS